MERLTLIVGAGASCGYGLPTGNELKRKIADCLDLRYQHFGLLEKGCDQAIDRAIRHSAIGEGGDPRDYQVAAHRIREAMPQSISIDNFIDSQRCASIERMGKLAIARCILKAERASSLWVDPRSDRRLVNFSALKDDWLGEFFQLLTQHCAVEDIQTRLSFITFVVFNYDRCIEHYLWSALQNYYGISAGDAAELLKSATFFHPYGTVGSLPWQGGREITQFGDQPEAPGLCEIAGRIKTFTEGTDESDSEICAIRESIQFADRLLFLGFAYNKQNMKLLRPASGPAEPVRRLSFGTAIGISDYDKSEIAREICTLNNSSDSDVFLRQDLKCHQIFSEFSRGIIVS